MRQHGLTCLRIWHKKYFGLVSTFAAFFNDFRHGIQGIESGARLYSNPEPSVDVWIQSPLFFDEWICFGKLFISKSDICILAMSWDLLGHYSCSSLFPCNVIKLTKIPYCLDTGINCRVQTTVFLSSSTLFDIIVLVVFGKASHDFLGRFSRQNQVSWFYLARIADNLNWGEPILPALYRISLLSCKQVIHPFWYQLVASYLVVLVECSKLCLWGFLQKEMAWGQPWNAFFFW